MAYIKLGNNVRSAFYICRKLINQTSLWLNANMSLVYTRKAKPEKGILHILNILWVLNKTGTPLITKMDKEFENIGR